MKLRDSNTKSLLQKWGAAALLGGLLAAPCAATAEPITVEVKRGTLAGSFAAPDMPLGEARLSAEQINKLNAVQAQSPLPGPRLPVLAAPAGAKAGTETNPVDGTRLPSTVRIFSNTTPNSVIPSGLKSNIDEPSTAMSGRVRFMTGNWYSAYSNNSGSTWTHLSPFTAFPSADGGFCCDQVTLYDPSRDMMTWLVQYIKSGSTASDQGRFRIALFRNLRNNIGPAGWIYYDFLPSGLGGPATGEWFDYPHMALSNNYLYVATNVFTTTTNVWTRTVMVRLNLDELNAGGVINFNYLSWTNNFNFTPAQGAKDTLYWATHQTTSSIRIFKWPETGSITFVDKTIPAWTSTNRNTSSCPTSDGQDWCLRTDHRILAGAHGWNSATASGDLSFFWNVKQGGAFAKPYIEAVKLRESDLAVTGRPYVWSSTIVYHYVAASPNARGDVALSLFRGVSPGFFPSSLICIDDDYNGVPPGWSCNVLRTGANGPSNNGWGDYIAVRPAHPSTFGWQATSFTLQGGKTGDFIEPRNYVFGRERDLNQYYRYYNR